MPRVISDANATHPGPQRAKRHMPPADWLLVLLVLVDGVFMVQSLFHRNPQLLPSAHATPGTAASSPWPFWSLDLLSPEAAISLFIGLMTLLYLRKQLALGFRPFFNYSCFQERHSQYGLGASGANELFWTATLKNMGQGLGTVCQASYSLQLRGESLLSGLTYEELRDYLESRSLTQGHEYSLVNISHGWTLGGGSERRILEIRRPQDENFLRLDIHLEFEGLLGDRYVKEIWCIPRLGIQ